MKQYPSITGKIVDQDIFAFAKYDGSNIRCEWTRKNGFSKFGSRNVLMDETHPFLSKAIGLFRETYEADLAQRFKKERYEEVVCFMEYFGTKSFAGFHHDDDTFQVMLFDLNVHKKGMLSPQEFLRVTDGLKRAEVLYRGKPNVEFLASVYGSTLEGMPLEGVVCKGAPLKNGYPPNMFKIKSNAWIERLKAEHKDDWEKLL